MVMIQNANGTFDEQSSFWVSYNCDSNLYEYAR
jgi:hypothetical protein